MKKYMFEMNDQEKFQELTIKLEQIKRYMESSLEDIYQYKDPCDYIRGETQAYVRILNMLQEVV